MVFRCVSLEAAVGKINLLLYSFPTENRIKSVMNKCDIKSLNSLICGVFICKVLLGCLIKTLWVITVAEY